MREDERLKSVGRGSFGKIAAEIEQMVGPPVKVHHGKTVDPPPTNNEKDNESMLPA